MMWGQQRKPRPTIAKSRRKARSRRPASQAVVFVPQPSLRDLQYFDTSFTMSTVAANWTYQNIFLPVQGNGSSSRYGDKTLAVSLNYFIYVNAAPVMRIIIYYDKQPNGANPTSPAPMLTLNTESFKDPDLRERFVILRDFWIGNVSSGAIASLNPHCTNHQRGYVKLHDLPTTFNASTGAVTDVQTGAFGICAYNGLSTATPITCNTRILFRS